MTRLDPRSRAAARGMSDIAIRNLFIIPTILFLIVFNIFPLIYSLGYSFTDFRASVNDPVNFVGLANFRRILSGDGHGLYVVESGAFSTTAPATADGPALATVTV